MSLPTTPTNPTKTDLLEKHWFEFLQHLKTVTGEDAGYYSNMIAEKDHEYAFWNWYLEHKLESKDAKT